MLSEQTMEKLSAMKLHGMAGAFRQWLDNPKGKDLEPADLIGMLADAEWIYRENRKLTSRLKTARFKQPACIEDIDYAHARGLNKAMVHDLATSRWAASKQNIIISGKPDPTT